MAEALQTLLDEDKSIATQRQLAALIGKSEPWVSDMLRILNLPAKLQTKLRTSETSVAYEKPMKAAPPPCAARKGTTPAATCAPPSSGCSKRWDSSKAPAHSIRLPSSPRLFYRKCLLTRHPPDGAIKWSHEHESR
jgi:hypothetical protein